MAYSKAPTKEKLRKFGRLSRKGDKIKFVNGRFKDDKLLDSGKVVGGNEFHS